MGTSSMAEDQPQPPREDFDARLREARRREEPDDGPVSRARETSQGMGLAFRIVSEFVAAVVVGVGIGLLLDSWLDTKPWLLIVFVLLGTSAGTLNVYRVINSQTPDGNKDAGTNG
jgi:ATP synthase protein I